MDRRSFPESKDRHISDDSTHIGCNGLILLCKLSIKICWYRQSHRIQFGYYRNNPNVILCKWLPEIHSYQAKGYRLSERIDIGNVKGWISTRQTLTKRRRCSELCTRIRKKQWFNGPQFLWNNKESNVSVHSKPLPETNDEIKTIDYLVASLTSDELDFIKYGDWKKLYRIPAYVKRFHTNWKWNSKKLKRFLTASEVKGTEIAANWHSIFYAEFNSVKQKKQ